MTAGDPSAGGRLDRFIEAIEVTAAWFLAAAIPDTYDFSRLLLAILIFWGMAGAGYRGEHITVDLLGGALGPRMRRAMDLFSNAVTLFAMAMFALMMWLKVLDTREEHVLTFDLRQPVWIYYLVAWLGLAASVLLLAVRVYRMALRPEALEPPGHSPSVE